jgi:hypothetical protein
MGRNLALRNDTTLYIYSPKGKQLLSVQQLTEKSVAVAAKKRVLTYDYGGKKLAVHSAGKTLMTHQFEDMVLGADLGEGGEYAVITSPSHYISKVSAYNSSFQRCSTVFAGSFVRATRWRPMGKDERRLVDGDARLKANCTSCLRHEKENRPDPP